MSKGNFHEKRISFLLSSLKKPVEAPVKEKEFKYSGKERMLSLER